MWAARSSKPGGVGVDYDADGAVGRVPAHRQQRGACLRELPPARPQIGGGIVKGIQLAFDGIASRIGHTEVELVILDNGDKNGQWQAELELANVQQAIDDLVDGGLSRPDGFRRGQDQSSSDESGGPGAD